MISVLYVDDEPDLLELARLFLENSGEFSVGISTSPEDVLRTRQYSSCDVIISDYQMPGMDGIGFLKEVRRLPGRIPFILFTGRGREEIVIQALNEGADFYLQKGGDPQAQFAELANKIRYAVARQRTERALAASEERYRSVVNDQTELIARFSPEGIITFVNEAYRNYFTPLLNRRDLEGRSFRDIMQVKNYDEVDRFLASLTPDRPIREMERQVRGPDGTMHWQIWSVRAFFDNGTRPVEYQVVGRDITDYKEMESALRKKNEELNASYEQIAAGEEELRAQLDEIIEKQEALRVSEEKFRAFAENIPDLTTISGEDGRYTYVSPSLLSLTGHTPGDILGKEVLGQRSPLGIHPDDIGRLRDLGMQAHGSPGQSIRVPPFRGRDRNGNLIYLDGTLTYLPDIPGIRGIVFHGRDITENIRAAEALGENEKRFQSLIETSPDMIWEIDIRGIFRYISPQIATIMGYTPEELVGRSITNLIPVHGRIHVIRALEQHIASPNPIAPIEVQALHRNGQEMIIEIRPNRITDRDGTLWGFYGVARDITERKRADEALRESEAKVRRIAENAPDMIYRMSLPDGRYEYVSPASVAITGYTPEEFYADPDLVRRLIHPAWHEYFQKEWAALLAKNVPPVYEFQIIDRAGRTRWVNQRNMLVTGEDGEPVVIEGIVTEITRQKETELELRRSEQRALAVSENAGSWIWEVDPGGLYRYSSPAVEKILGYRPEELVGKMHFFDLFDPDQREDLKRISLAAFGRREPFRNFTNPNIHKNGSQVILNTSGTPLFDEKGTFTGYCGVDDDITERRRSEEALRRANHQLNLLTGITRHDIVNKIMVVLGYLTMARRKCADPAILEYLGKMEEAVALIRQQIEFTKIYQSLGTHEPRWFRLADVVPHANIPVTISLINEMQDYSIFADAMLEKVFFNLLDNSIRHGRRVTQIRASAHITDSELLVIWEDNGIGIPNHEKMQIFERGYGNNTGLGLFLVREILALTGITIMETGEEGRGARFEILVPKGAYRLNDDRHATTKRIIPRFS